MNRSATWIRLASLILFAAAASLHSTASEQSSETALAFVNVSVVPVDSERVLEKQTVIVRNGRIAQIGPSTKTRVPSGAAEIDGSGKYLIPGLSEMHAHLPPFPGEAGDPAAQQMALYLANGVTTIRGMIGSPNNLKLRERVTRGETIGPMIFAAGPPLHAQVAPSPAAAEQMVIDQKKAGYDFIKVHEGLSPDTYASIIAAGKRAGIPIAGHVTASVGLKRALDARQSCIEHLDGYLQMLVREDSPVKPPPSQVVVGPVLGHIDESKLPALAEATRKAGVRNSMTLALFKLVVSDDKPEDLLKRPEMQYVSQNMRNAFAKQKQSTMNNPPSPSDRQRYLELRNKVAKALYDGGAELLVGSDSPQFFLVPGFAAHREMQSMAEAGLKPYAVLEAATKNVAEYLSEALGVAKDFGTVAVGNRADLVLLDANPLSDIANASRIAGVMVRGKWIPASELRKMLDQVASANRAPAQ
jgi:imidazolonepropionase-like amidohydrolase